MKIEFLGLDRAYEIWQLLHLAQAQAPVASGATWSLEDVKAELQVAVTWGLWAGAELEGFVCVRQMGDVWELIQLATHPRAQRQGLMSQLLRHVLWRLPEGGQVWLDVHQLNSPAQALYRRLGFEMVGRRPRYYSDGGEALLFSYVPSNLVSSKG